MSVLKLKKIWSQKDPNFYAEDEIQPRFTAEGLKNYWLVVDRTVRFCDSTIMKHITKYEIKGESKMEVISRVAVQAQVGFCRHHHNSTIHVITGWPRATPTGKEVIHMPDQDVTGNVNVKVKDDFITDTTIVKTYIIYSFKSYIC